MITRSPGTQTLSCKITLGPLSIETEASLDQVRMLILGLVKEYRELPKIMRILKVKSENEKEKKRKIVLKGR